METLDVPVTDPFGAADDPKMPFLTSALDPVEARCRLERFAPRFAGVNGAAHLRAIRVTRHKPGRRCLVEYDFAVERADAPAESVTVIGKARARGLDRASYRLLKSLWSAGFGADSRDGICVPEPIGLVPTFEMWLQRKVPGTVATRLLTEAGGVVLAERIAGLAHKLHQVGIPVDRRHTMADELRILHERLSIVAGQMPRWANRLDRLLDACDRLGTVVRDPIPCGIHRDFYPDQVIVDGPRLYLVDLDLYCAGDPGLDVGNFLGHIKEQSLRTLGDADALVDREAALEERFVQLAGEGTRPAVHAYTTLTLARHISLSMQLAGRGQWTERLLELCEARLGTADIPAEFSSPRNIATPIHGPRASTRMRASR